MGGHWICPQMAPEYRRTQIDTDKDMNREGAKKRRKKMGKDKKQAGVNAGIDASIGKIG